MNMDKNTLIIGGIVVVGLFFLMNQRQPMQQGGFGLGGQQGGFPNVGPGAVNQTASDVQQWGSTLIELGRRGAEAYFAVRNASQNPQPTGNQPART